VNCFTGAIRKATPKTGSVNSKTLRNQIVTNTRNAKKHFFIWHSKCRSDPKKFWSVVKSVKPRTHLPCSLSNGQVTVASCTITFLLWSSPVCRGDVAVYGITQDEVYMHLRMIKLNSAAGPDGITSWILCTFADVIPPSLASLYNLSIYTGQRPADWKLSNVVPIPTEPNRLGVLIPVTLLPIVSEVLERHLHQLLID